MTDSVTIETPELRVVVLPGFGARVVSFIDRRSGRDWMARGPETSSNFGEDAAYGAPEAIGWDECFPTVSAWDATGTPWRRRLRDHGDVWGRPWRVDAQSPTLLTTSYADRDFRFERTLSVAGDRLTVDYRVTNLSTDRLPCMWAWHALLALQAGERIDLPDTETVDVAYIGVNGRHLPPGTQPWPRGEVIPFPLDEVQPLSAEAAVKLHTRGTQSRAVLGGRQGRLTLAWSGVDALGIWLTYGGWPAPGDIHQVALEPTSSKADHLGQAIERGNAWLLPAGGNREWQLVLTATA